MDRVYARSKKILPIIIIITTTTTTLTTSNFRRGRAIGRWKCISLGLALSSSFFFLPSRLFLPSSSWVVAVRSSPTLTYVRVQSCQAGSLPSEARPPPHMCAHNPLLGGTVCASCLLVLFEMSHLKVSFKKRCGTTANFSLLGEAHFWAMRVRPICCFFSNRINLM